MLEPQTSNQLSMLRKQRRWHENSLGRTLCRDNPDKYFKYEVSNYRRSYRTTEL